jgi:DNA-directed RNA polymerase subunit RPC12/RpoP
LKKSIGSSKIVVDKTNDGGEKPMLCLDDIKVEFESKEFKGTHIGISPEKDKSVLFPESVRSTQTVRCPYCGGSVYIYENGQVKLKDIPIQRGTAHILN